MRLLPPPPASLTIHDALVEIRHLGTGDATARRAKYLHLRRDRPRIALLAERAGVRPDLRALIQTGVRLARV
jgi:hypothetical protein